MSRSKWKGPYVTKSLITYKEYKEIKDIITGETIFKENNIYSRNSSITSNLLNKQLRIYNGKLFKMIIPNKEIKTFKLGEFSFTRKQLKHKAKKK